MRTLINPAHEPGLGSDPAYGKGTSKLCEVALCTITNEYICNSKNNELIKDFVQKK